MLWAPLDDKSHCLLSCSTAVATSAATLIPEIKFGVLSGGIIPDNKKQWKGGKFGTPSWAVLHCHWSWPDDTEGRDTNKSVGMWRWIALAEGLSMGENILFTGVHFKDREHFWLTCCYIRRWGGVLHRAEGSLVYHDWDFISVRVLMGKKHHDQMPCKRKKLKRWKLKGPCRTPKYLSMSVQCNTTDHRSQGSVKTNNAINRLASVQNLTQHRPFTSTEQAQIYPYLVTCHLHLLLNVIISAYLWALLSTSECLQDFKPIVPNEIIFLLIKAS